MPIFVQLVSFSSNRGSFDEKNDTVRINEYLSALQSKRAVIKSVTPAIGGATSATAAVYVIMYEADEVIAFR
jgi:hypothetical protein